MKYLRCLSCILLWLFQSYLALEIWQPSIDECTTNTECVPLTFTQTPFNLAEEVEAMYYAVHHIASEKRVIDILMIRNLQQRLQIMNTFNYKYKQNLVEVLPNVLSGKVKNLVLAMLMPLDDFYAKELNDSISDPISYGPLLEILGSLSNKGIRAVTRRYKQMYKTSLRRVLHSKRSISNELKDLCISLTLGYREKSSIVDEEQAKEDAMDLYEAGEAEWDQYVYKDLLVHRSFSHLLNVFQAYNKLTPLNVYSTVTSGFPASFTRGLLTLVDIAENRSRFFAQRIRKSLTGQYLYRHKTLIRIIVTRSEIDLGNILINFKTMFNLDWIEAVKNAKHLMGNFEIALIRLLGEKPFVTNHPVTSKPAPGLTLPQEPAELRKLSKAPAITKH